MVVWGLLLAMVIAAQCLTVGRFETGHWEAGGDTPETAAEKLWYRLPLASIILISMVFLTGARWLVRAKPPRSAIRIWGLLLTIVALLVSLGMSAYYHLTWYMD